LDEAAVVTDAIFLNSLLAVLFMGLIFFLDRYERESPAVLAAVFFASIMASFLFGVVKGSIVGERELPLLLSAYVEAGFFEELLKFGLLAAVIYGYKGFNESFDLIVYAGVIALGFAFLENIGYYVSMTLPFAIFREVTGASSPYYQSLSTIMASRIVPAHMLIDVGAVYFAGRKSKITPLNLASAFAVAVLLHGTWNTLAMKESPWFIFYVFLLTIAAAGSLYSLSSRSAYLERSRRLRERIENNLFLLAHAGSELKAEVRRNYVRTLGEIRKCLDVLKYLKGSEQTEFYDLVEKTFPSPASLLSAEASPDAAAKLGVIADRLKCWEERKFDWSYYVMLLGVFFGAGLTAILLISLIV
jgi:RsiW-degrading membrane proteinase PrsW (M82 family)